MCKKEFFPHTKSGDTMITNYKIDKNNTLYLYFDYSFEFGKLGVSSKKGIFEEIKKFIQNKKIAFYGSTILLVIGGITFASIHLKNPILPDTSFSLTKNIIEKVTLLESEENEVQAPVLDLEVKPDEITQQKPIEVPDKIQNIANQNKPANPSLDTSKEEVTDPKEDIKQETVQDEKPEKIFQNPVTIKRSNGDIIILELEEYLIGVVASEMPASFHIEALKAQAIAARTYTLRRIAENKTLTDTTSTQVYKDLNQLKKEWGNNFSTYYEKVKKAVEATKGMYLSYNGYYIDAVYHSTSNGFTTDAKEVWGNDIPYLQSVESPWDINTTFYEKTKKVSTEEWNKIFGITYDENTTIEILEKDKSGRILSVQIGNQIFSGKQFQSLLKLQSTDFEIKVENNTFIITTHGWGHGVGMSQFGAHGMAKEGYTFDQILKYYYKGVQISS